MPSERFPPHVLYQVNCLSAYSRVQQHTKGVCQRQKRAIVVGNLERVGWFFSTIIEYEASFNMFQWNKVSTFSYHQRMYVITQAWKMNRLVLRSLCYFAWLVFVCPVKQHARVACGYFSLSVHCAQS